MSDETPRIRRVAGSLVEVSPLRAALYELAFVGDQKMRLVTLVFEVAFDAHSCTSKTDPPFSAGR